ncbi:hypothetical protein [Paenibacillus taichungensis]|uniref:hypothetical protein n=1 Tax=Paenibacillus taichungensis TaxID=484184 RepID=UPI0039A169C1
MAAPRKTANTEPVKDVSNESISDKEKVSSELEELRAMVKQLLEDRVATQSVPIAVEKEKDEYYDIEEELNINSNQLVKIVSLIEGGLNLKGNSPQPLYLPEFGATRSVTYEELRAIYYNHPELTRNGAFFILNKNVVKALYLDSDYESILNRERLDKLVDLPTAEMMSVLKGLTKVQKETFIQRYIQGIKSQDNRFGDFNKIKAIDDYIGNSLVELASEKSN